MRDHCLIYKACHTFRIPKLRSCITSRYEHIIIYCIMLYCTMLVNNTANNILRTFAYNIVFIVVLWCIMLCCDKKPHMPITDHNTIYHVIIAFFWHNHRKLKIQTNPIIHFQKIREKLKIQNNPILFFQ